MKQANSQKVEVQEFLGTLRELQGYLVKFGDIIYCITDHKNQTLNSIGKTLRIKIIINFLQIWVT